jgi:hypothetical protein
MHFLSHLVAWDRSSGARYCRTALHEHGSVRCAYEASGSPCCSKRRSPDGADRRRRRSAPLVCVGWSCRACCYCGSCEHGTSRRAWRRYQPSAGGQTAEKRASCIAPADGRISCPPCWASLWRCALTRGRTIAVWHRLHTGRLHNTDHRRLHTGYSSRHRQCQCTLSV